jgi:hypothetical protein
MVNLKFRASVSNEGVVSVALSTPKTTGNTEKDKEILFSAEAFRKTVADTIATWQECAVKTLHDERDFSADCKVRNQPDGFTVEIKRPDGELTEFFNRKAEMIGSSGMIGNVTVKTKNNYSRGPKGFIFVGGSMDFGDEHSSIKVKNQNVSGFLMPEVIRYEVIAQKLSSNNLDIVLDFSNYTVN